MRKNKKGVSAIVTTILLILISVVAVGLIAGFMMPMLKESLKGGASCFELIDYVKIAQSQYSCYDSEKTSLQIERGMNNYSIKGIIVSIAKAGESTRYELRDGKTVNGVKMKDGSEVIQIPTVGGSRTYVFLNEGNSETAKLAVITENEKVCEMETFKIPEC